MINGCLENNELIEATSFYHRIVLANSRPNKFTYPTLFKASTIACAIQECLKFHSNVLNHGLSEDGYIKSAGIQMYASFGCVREVR